MFSNVNSALRHNVGRRTKQRIARRQQLGEVRAVRQTHWQSLQMIVRLFQKKKQKYGERNKRTK